MPMGRLTMLTSPHPVLKKVVIDSARKRKERGSSNWKIIMCWKNGRDVLYASFKTCQYFRASLIYSCFRPRPYFMSLVAAICTLRGWLKN